MAKPDAVASAYSLDDYRIAGDLGGEEAYQNLRDRAWTRGIRLSSDMVPNHMGIDSRWVIDHPEWFLSLPEPPYPVYSYSGPDLSDDPRVGIVLEDHYWDDTDAAVVFKRFDRETGDERYVYHGNDGTSFPWNDTAQLDFLDPAVREQVIQTILAVARQFPIIRFDAAMVLAKKHIQRLWWPEPGSAGAIPSRAEHAIPKAEFDRLMPHEFWREVVDRVAAGGARARSCWPRRSGCSRAISSGRSGCTASTTARSCTCSATRTGPATGRSSRRPSSSTRRSSSATSTS